MCPTGRTISPRCATDRGTSRRTPAKRPPQILRPILPIRQRQCIVRRISLQLRARSCQQILNPEETPPRQPQHLQGIHRSLPLQRQIPQATPPTPADRVRRPICPIICYKEGRVLARSTLPDTLAYVHKLSRNLKSLITC